MAGASPPDISYDQSLHPGAIRIPIRGGDLWRNSNNSRNSLFRDLSPDWISLRLKLSVNPTDNYQQAHLALYQDDDHYLEIGVGYNSSLGGESVLMVLEDLIGQNWDNEERPPQIINRVGFADSSVYLRLDRNLTNDFVSGYYSLNGVNWLFLGESSQELFNPRVAIWAGGYDGEGLAYASLEWLEVVTRDEPVLPVLATGPRALLFTATAGQTPTNIQQLRIIERRALAPIPWHLETQASWLAASVSNGMTPAVPTLSVNAAGLGPGVYRTSVNVTSPVAMGASSEVTLVVNPTGRVAVATWRAGHRGAMSVSVDDSQESGFAKLLAQSFAGTYYLWGRSPYQTFASFRTAGMELGCHTVNHYCFAMNEPTRRYELEANIAGVIAGTGTPAHEVISFAWPCGLTTVKDRIIAEDYFLSSRGYNLNQLEDPAPQDWMNLKSFNSHENDPAPFNPLAPPNPADLKPLVDAAVQQGKWFNLVLHTFNNDDDAIAYAVGRDVWMAPIGSVVKYMKLRERTLITNYTETANSLSFNFQRLPIEASQRRGFEDALTTNDLVTLELDVTGIPSAGPLIIGGVSRSFFARSEGARQRLFVDTACSTNLATVELNLNGGVPLAFSQRVTLSEDASTNIVIEASGLAGHPLAFEIIQPPLYGNLSASAPDLQYVPESNFFGRDEFRFRARDTVNELSATGVVQIVVAPVGDAPMVVQPLTFLMAEYGVALGTNLAGVFLDLDGEGLIFSQIGFPPGLVLSGAGVVAGIPTQAGNFPASIIAAKATQPGLRATNHFAFLVQPASAEVTLNNLQQVYDGTAREVTATTQPENLSVQISYADLLDAPTNAGVYLVIGVVTDENYQGSATNQLTVSPAPVEIQFGNLFQWANGYPRGVTVTTTPPDVPVDLTYDGSIAPPVTAGSFQVVGTAANANYYGNATNQLIVADPGLSISQVQLSSANDLAITWTSIPGITYQLESIDELELGEWLPVGAPITANATSVTVTNLTVSEPQRFYRVQLLP